MKPTNTLIHNVKNRIKTPKIIPVFTSTPCNENNPVMLPSVIPIPPGINDNAPFQMKNNVKPITKTLGWADGLV